MIHFPFVEKIFKICFIFKWYLWVNYAFAGNAGHPYQDSDGGMLTEKNVTRMLRENSLSEPADIRFDLRDSY